MQLCFSGLYLSFLEYLKLKRRKQNHHTLKKPTNKKDCLFKTSYNHCYNTQLNVSSSLLLLIKLLSLGATQETVQGKFKI